MFNPHLFETIGTIFERCLNPPVYNELPTSNGIARSNESHQEFMHRVQQIFVERGYEKLNSESTFNKEILLFTRNEALHLVYCLPFLTTIEVRACWEAQCSLGAYSSSVVAPHRFSEAAKHKAQSLAIELLPVKSG